MEVVNIKQNYTPIFIIDDDEDTVIALKALLNFNGMANVQTFTDPHDLEDAMNESVRIIIVDHFLNSDMTGLSLVKKILQKYRHVYFIMLSGQDNIDVAIEFMNSTYDGCRYVKKAEIKQCELIIRYIREFITQIELLASIYSGMKEVKDALENASKINERK